MTPLSLRDFFMAGAGAGSALIGLLFVAVSVSGDRLVRGEDAALQRVRASAALTAFTNALAVSLFALIPGHKLGITTIVVSITGLGFIVAALLSLRRGGTVKWRRSHDAVFLVGLLATFVAQLVEGIELSVKPHAAGDARTIAVLVVVCFLIGIARSWELLGGPSIGIGKELRAVVTHDTSR